MSDKVVEFNKDNFEDEVIKSEVPVLVDFWAAWCVPCKMIAPTVQELAEEYGEKVKFGKVNVDENRDISGRFGIRGIPSLLLFKDGKVLEQMVGVHSKQEIAEMVAKAV
jgi:thioredoxin 1